ncbi:MAG: hypothetical protein AAFO69_17385, partial [Bacteroidota bacterium]
MTNIVLTLLSLIASLVLVEAGLRIVGFKPNPSAILDEGIDRTVVIYDSILGWNSVPGEYVFPPYDSSEHGDIFFTIHPSMSRKTSEATRASRRNRPKMIFVGGSFTQGWAISDWETFTWKVQQE